MTDRWRVGANLATLANGLLGVGAILYTLAGNKEWAMLLVASAIGFDGLDGLLSRRSPLPPSRFGRVADSVADATTFGAAPAVLIAVHTSDVPVWQPFLPALLALAAVYLIAAVARLVYFTARAHALPHFLGVPTPQSALALVTGLLVVDAPAWLGPRPWGLLVLGAVLSVTMVLPLRFPKIRRGTPLRGVSAATAGCAAVALTVVQFRPADGSPLSLIAVAATVGLALGVGSYYLYGPFSLRRTVVPAG